MTVAFVWDNFGPLHADRVEAVAARLGPGRRVVGIELSPVSDTYPWVPVAGSGFTKQTLFASAAQARNASAVTLARAVVRAARASGATAVFLCSYHRPGILLAAHRLRLGGVRVFLMGCSKFDDAPRRLVREGQKRLALAGLAGAIGSGTRSRDYFRWLGLPPDRIVGEYNAASLARIRAEAGVPPAPAGPAFDDRHLTVVARFVPEKDLATGLAAYARYRALVPTPRPLHLFGDGPLEAALRAQGHALGIADHVRFEGFAQSAAVSRALGSSLALILPSRVEPFGNAVIEAQAMGVPAIVTTACGAADCLIRPHRNGFVVRPGDVEGIAACLAMLEDEPSWRAMAAASVERAALNDAARFADGVVALLDGGVASREPVESAA